MTIVPYFYFAITPVYAAGNHTDASGINLSVNAKFPSIGIIEISSQLVAQQSAKIILKIILICRVLVSLDAINKYG